MINLNPNCHFVTIPNSTDPDKAQKILSNLFNDNKVIKMFVYGQCTNTYPCSHDCKIALKDNSILELTLSNRIIKNYMKKFSVGPEGMIDGSNLSHFDD